MAELAGASSAIVHDDVYEALIIMSKPRDHPDPGIPAVFVSEKAGIIMRKLMTPGVTRVRIMPVSRMGQQLLWTLFVCTVVVGLPTAEHLYVFVHSRMLVDVNSCMQGPTLMHQQHADARLDCGMPAWEASTHY